MHTIRKLPILATIPRSGTWFLRYAVSFLIHLDRGGRVEDRVTREIVGRPSGVSFDFHRFQGGPLFLSHRSLPSEHLLIGHTVCPGFANIAGDFAWWPKTDFHVPGYDYLHDDLNYAYTPVDLAPEIAYAPLSVPALERAASAGHSAPLALVYRNPVAQAASYFRYCIGHESPAYNMLEGRPLAQVPFCDYLFGSALPSYAKQFVSFQAVAERHPGLVRFVPYECLVARPIEVLADLLNHLLGTSRSDWRNLHLAAQLARREHLRAIEAELGRSLDRTRTGNGSHMRHVRFEDAFDGSLREETIRRLRWMGIDAGYFVWPAANDRGYARPQERRVAAE